MAEDQDESLKGTQPPIDPRPPSPARSQHDPHPSARWVSWQKDIQSLSFQVSNLHARQLVWKAYVAAMEHVRVTGSASIFHNWMIDNHADALTMGIRRLIDRGMRNHATVSLHTLITDIAHHADEVNLDNFLAVWKPRDPHSLELAKETFLRLFPTPHDRSKEALVAEATTMRKEAEILIVHANKRIAHTDRTNLSDLPTWADVDRALEVVAKVLRRYYLLLICGDYLVEHTVMPFGWEEAIQRACSASVQRST